MWKNTVETDKSQMTTRRMALHAAYLRLQTHTQHVILIAFSTAKIVARTCLNVTLDVHCLYCLATLYSRISLTKVHNVTHCHNFTQIWVYVGQRGGVVVKALGYKPAGRRFDSRWCHWNFSVTILPVALWPWGSTQPLTEMSIRCISWR